MDHKTSAPSIRKWKNFYPNLYGQILIKIYSRVYHEIIVLKKVNKKQHIFYNNNNKKNAGERTGLSVSIYDKSTSIEPNRHRDSNTEPCVQISI